MSRRRSWLTLCVLVFAIFPLPGIAQSSDPFSPTASQDPAVIDKIWQKSVAKYDTERAKILVHVDEVNASGAFHPDWESLKSYQVPDWYKDAKFGIFLHWGVYSVPAFGSEWYPRLMYIPGSPEYQHHVLTYGSQDKFGYKDFVPKFKAEHYDPASWAKLFKDSGAKYVVPVFEHHDGFQMYDSALSDWTAVKQGPHRDLWGDLAKAVRAEGLHLGASSHRVEHNFFLGVGRAIQSDVNDPQNASLYGPAHNWLEAKEGTPLLNDYTYVSSAWTHDWLARSAEIVEKYHPDLMYFDWWIGQPSVRPDLVRFAAFYYNASSKNGTVGVINYKDWAMFDFTPEEKVVTSVPVGKHSPAPNTDGHAAGDAAELFSRGVALEEDPRNHMQAIVVYQRVLELDPQHAAAHINLGTLHYNRQDYVSAEEHYRRALEIDPRYALAHFDLGNVLDETGRVSEAIQTYLTAIQLAPTYADAHYNLALAYEKMKEPRKALKHWQSYVKLDGTGPWATHARAQVKRILKTDPLKLVFGASGAQS